MEFNERKFKPESNRTLLYQQVSEQSDICDVTVTVGNWQKKFHWCVLVMSPFFESLRRNNFIEKQTGMIQLNISTPLVTEMAIAFLYGKKPKITEDNVSPLLALSEFLLVPNLKCSCVKFLKTLSITDENCMTMLELSSLYDFGLQKAYDYIRGHMQDILLKDEAVSLTKESIIELFEDPLLSYVPSEDKFTFLMRWAKVCFRNESMFPDIFNAIDFENIDSDFFETLVLNNTLVVQMSSNNSTFPHLTTSDMHRVLVFPDMKKEDRLACFDLNKEKWCGIDVGLGEDSEISRQFRHSDIAAVRGKPYADIYRMKKIYQSNRVLRQTLGTNQVTDFNVSIHVPGEESNDSKTFDHWVIVGETFFAASNDRTEKKKIKDHSIPFSHRNEVLRIGSRLGFDLYSKVIAQQCMRNRYEPPVYSDSVTFYQGILQHPNTHIVPLLTICNAKIAQLCINASRVAAFLKNDRKTLYIYDIDNCTMDKVQIDDYLTDNYAYGNSMLAATEDGFSLYSKNEMLCICRLNGPALRENYAVQKVGFEYEATWQSVEYFFCENRWFRFLHRSWEEDHEFACVSHETLLTKEDGQEIPWTSLPITKELGNMRRENHVFVISLPRSSVACHFNCPHCQQLKSKSRTCIVSYKERDSVFDVFYEDCDFDIDYGNYNDYDDYGGYYYGGYDSDDDHYYCSN